MMESPDKVVHLRIRFAGLCLFVPDPAKKLVHVLMPKTGAKAAHHAHAGHSVAHHPILIHWVSGRQKKKESLTEPLVLSGPEWGAPDMDLCGVFHLRAIGPACGCPAGSHGKADPDPNRTAARMELHAGTSQIINRGAWWRIGSSEHPMPTVLDWWVRDVRYGDLEAMLQGWGVFGTALPDVGTGDTVNLWILHAPQKEQHPEQITSEPIIKGGDPHFSAYYTLLTCHECNVEPSSPDVRDPDWPGSPNKAREDKAGMLVNCMLAKADLA